MNKLFIRLLEHRGLKPDFLKPKYNDLADPFILRDMDKAVARLVEAKKNGDKILIYGDYDVDGVTASTLMEETLKLAGIKSENITIMLPDRFTDGYGMSPKLVDRAKTEKIKLVITVDCGSRNHTIVKALNELGIDSIITDHHETELSPPESIAFINPHRQDHPTVSLQNLAGVGVAFKLAQALVSTCNIPDGQEKWLLDLVLLGTICDSMTLTGENRILTYYGIKVLAKTRRPGLRELIRKSNVKSYNSNNIGFQIGPRLNAAGRLGTATIALDLLRTHSAPEAASLAEELEQLNKKRKAEQISATRSIKERGVSDDPVVIQAGEWHEGIIGIVAGHLVEDYHKPAFVFTNTGNDILKGSGRSFGDFNLAEALNFTKSIIISGGGHAGAAGVTIKQENFPQFCSQINEYYKSLKLPDQTKYFKQHADLDLDDFSDLTLDLLQDLASLEPFGPGNEEPIFRLKNINITNLARMGADHNHLRLDLHDRSGRRLKLVAFFAPDQWLKLDPTDPMLQIEPLVKLTENYYNGVRSIEARIVDLELVDFI